MLQVKVRQMPKGNVPRQSQVIPDSIGKPDSIQEVAMKKLLFGVFALVLVVLVFGFALRSDSYQAQPGDHANAIVTNVTNLVTATDTDVGQVATAFYTSALIESTALAIASTSSAIDPGGGTIIMMGASFGSTFDMVSSIFSASRASPDPLVTDLVLGADSTIPMTALTDVGGVAILAYLVDRVNIEAITTMIIITSALALGAVTVLILARSFGGVRIRWSRMTRGYVPTTADAGSRAATRMIKSRFGLAFGAT